MFSFQQNVNKKKINFTDFKSLRRNALIVCEKGLTAIVGQTKEKLITYIHENNNWIDNVFKCAVLNERNCMQEYTESGEKTKKSSKPNTKPKPSINQSGPNCDVINQCFEHRDGSFVPVLYDDSDPYSCTADEYKTSQIRIGFANRRTEAKDCYDGSFQYRSSNYYCKCSTSTINRIRFARCKRHCQIN